jgi:hypothetical protein
MHDAGLFGLGEESTCWLCLAEKQRFQTANSCSNLSE